ncbi:MAG: cyclic nucleotide-binding domain-containing protein [Desulfobacteraceae bacterium]|nr:cyclic nucleotide-binding domain-containing protein [Desulfobacteraceae bacterium]
MVKIEDLKRINLLSDMPDHLLEILAKEAQLSIFGTHTQLFNKNENVDTFYMLVMGQVAMKIELTETIDIIIDYIQSGSSFGLSSLLTNSTATYSGVCQEPCEVITLSAPRTIKLFEENNELGYQIMLRLAKKYKVTMDKRAQMIMKTLGDNPEFKQDIKDIENLTLIF